MNFSPAEAKKLKQNGVVMVEYDPKSVFDKSLGVKTLICPSIVFGYQTGPDRTADDVYKFVKALIEHSDELLKVEQGLQGL